MVADPYHLLARGIAFGQSPNYPRLRLFFFLSQLIVLLSVLSYPLPFSSFINGMFNRAIPFLPKLTWLALISLFAIIGIIGQWTKRL